MPSFLVEHGEQPVSKRRKLITPSEAEKLHVPRIFAPYRTLGLVSSTDVPFTSVSLGKATFQITTSVGRCLHTFDLRRGLNLVFVTRPQTPTDITATFAWKDRVLAAWGGGLTKGEMGVWVFKRGKRIGELEMPIGTTDSIRQLIVFGSWIVGCCSNRLEVWRSATYEHYTTLIPAGLRLSRGTNALSGVLCNMPTMLNKVLVGKQDGSAELWNLSKGKLVYTIAPPKLHTGPVTAIQPSPALSVAAIARADCSIMIHDVRLDETIIILNHNSGPASSITSISFRTDGMGAGNDGRQAGVMATSSSSHGDVTLWDLNNGGRIMGILHNAHNPPSTYRGEVSGGVSRVEFLPGQPVLVSSGRDNSLKSWIFDEAPFSPIPRILHSRCGHAAPVTRLGFLPADADGADAVGKWLLSAGKDQSLWGWSLRREGQSTELSQGNIRKQARKMGLLGKALDIDSKTTLEDLKAAEITHMACSLNRDGGMGASAGGGTVWANISNKQGKANTADKPMTGWESIVTGHRGDKLARTWFWGRKKAGRWAFETSDGSEVKSVAITACGTFALIGSAGGSIDMFNLQSGVHRRRFPSPLTPSQVRKKKILQANAANDTKAAGNKYREFNPGEGKHTRDVTGIMVDSLNQTVVSCSLDGKIKFWDFETGLLHDEIDWNPMTAMTACRYHSASDLLALSCDDLSIRVVDIGTRKLVREFWGCVGPISDFCFSNDGRWIVAASMDSVIRVWDNPTGQLINAMRVEGACTALAFSPTGEFLATAHADTVGINVWTNRTLFTHVSTRHISEKEVIVAGAPTASGEGGEGLLAAAFEDDYLEDVDLPDATPLSIRQLSSGMQTLSLVPRARWRTLLHLDTIHTRNKPIEPPKVPEKAPFFLPSLEGPGKPGSLAPATDRLTSVNGADSVVPQQESRIVCITRAPMALSALLHSSHQSQDYTPFVAYLSSLAPSAADVEIRSLSPLADPSDPTQPLELVLFVNALTARLRDKRDYELVQVWMAVFLRVHGDRALDGGGGGLRLALEEWREVQGRERERLGRLVGFCGGVVGWVRSGR